MTARGQIPADKHGTQYGYAYYACRCRPCTDAKAEYMRKYNTGVGIDFYDNHASRDEVKQWAFKLGLPVNANLLGRHGRLVVERWNREHPDRPYVYPQDRRTAS